METSKRKGARTPAAPAPWTVLIAFVLITILATKYVWDSSRLADQARFTSAVQAASDAMRFRLDTYINVLRAATGLFAANRAATRDEFRAYVQHLRIPDRYPGIQGIGLSLRVKPEDVKAVIADMRANDFSDFRIWPEEPARSEYHTVVSLEPMDRRNKLALGYDMYTSLPRRLAMDRARDTGEPASTGAVRLIQEVDPGKQSGFLIYVPIYKVLFLPETMEARHEQLYGFVYAPFRAGDLFRSTLPQGHPEVRFVILDGPDVLYDSDPGRGGTPRFQSVVKLPVAGRTWTIDFSSERTGVGAPLFVTLATLVVGLAISLLLFALLQLQARGRANAERTAERLQRSEAELQQANRAKDEFLATLSHELRTPMTSILGWSKLLADPLDEETHAAAVDSIQKSSRAQAQLIDDLLDVSRITAGKMRIEPRALDLSSIVIAATDAVAPVAEAKRLTLHRSTPGEPVRVNGDASRLQQVMWNLLTNAVKFTPEGGTIDVKLRIDGGEAELSVTDSGQGIEPKFLPYVFERFRQADSSTTRAYTGLGLGLAIVRHLVELHGGAVTAESEGLGKGSRFIVRLPLLDAHAEFVAPPPGTSAASVNSLRGVDIILVDDETTVRGYAATVFTMAGANVRVAGSAREALELLAAARPDVVMTDIGMPDMDGYELLKEIRSQPGGHIPVIALTAYARPEDRDSIEAAGFDGLVTKPVEPAQLRAAVAEAIGHTTTPV